MPPSPDTLYAQISENLRASDDFSFKLLGLVPLSTLLTIMGVLVQKDLQWSPGFYALGLFGAVLVWGIFRWELRNIQRCIWYCHVLDDMEAEANSAIPEFKRYKKPQFLGRPMGKTESEKLIYTVLIVAWLTFPLLVRNLSQVAADPESTGWDTGYYICAGIVMVAAVTTCFSNLKRKKENG